MYVQLITKRQVELIYFRYTFILLHFDLIKFHHAYTSVFVVSIIFVIGMVVCDLCNGPLIQTPNTNHVLHPSRNYAYKVSRGHKAHLV